MSYPNFEGDDISASNALKFTSLAVESMQETIEHRRKNKLSVSRFSSILRELKELKKVLILYSTNNQLTEINK